MAVPAGHELHALPAEHLVAVDEVLEHLVQGVANVQVAVRVWGTVMQHKLFASVVFLK